MNKNFKDRQNIFSKLYAYKSSLKIRCAKLIECYRQKCQKKKEGRKEVAVIGAKISKIWVCSLQTKNNVF